MLDYKKEYERWKEADLPDFDLRRELDSLSGKDDEIKEHFGRSLEFGTAGIRGTLGVGTNRRQRRVWQDIFLKKAWRSWWRSAMIPV